MVRLLAIADEEAPQLTATRLREIKPDLVLAAGDLSWSYLEYVASAIDAPMVFVPGNHDPAIRGGKQHRNGTWTRDGIIADAPRPLGWINADGRVVEAGGLRIAGLGGSVRYRPGPHQYTQAEFGRRAFRLIRQARRTGPINILLTHAPPRGCGDAEDQPHHGVEALHAVLEDLQPTWHLHGHIHPFGQEQPDRVYGRTLIRNVIPYRVVEFDALVTR